MCKFGPHSNFNGIAPEKTLIADRNVSEHFQVSEQLKVTVSFFKKRHLTLQFSAPVLSTQVLELLSFLFGHLSSDILTFLHFLFLFLSNPVSLKPCFPYSSSSSTDSPSMCVCVSVCVCVFWSQRHCSLPTLCKNGPSVCACKCVCVCFLYGELDSCGYCSLLTLSPWCQAELSKPGGKLNQKKLYMRLRANTERKAVQHALT